MAGTYEYYSSSGSKVSVTNKINFCLRDGPMSFCRACTTADQHGCKHREDATNDVDCLYYRVNYDGACDCLWAQKNVDKPKDEDDEAEQAITGTEIIPT